MLFKTRLVICAITVLCLFSSRGLATTLTDPKYGFTITIPDGFVPDSQLAAKKASIIYAFRQPGRAEPISDPRIVIERLNGPLGRGGIRPEDLPKTFSGSLISARWQGFDIDGAEFIENVGGVQLVTYKAQVPLQHEAIQIWATGSLEHGDQTRALLDQLLVSLDGQSSWQNSEASVGTAGSSHYNVIMLAAGIASVVIGFVVLLLVRRKSQRGTVLMLAVVIYAISFAIHPGHVAELYMVVGCTRFLGVLAFILGGVDAVRYRRRPGTPPPLPPFCQQCKSHHRPGAEFCSQCGVAARPSAAPIRAAAPVLRQAVWVTALVVLMFLPVLYVLNSAPPPGEAVQARTLPLSPSSQPIAAVVPDVAPIPQPPVQEPVVRRPAVIHQPVARTTHIKTPMCGGRGGGPYLICSPTDRPVIGFEYETGTWMKKEIVHTLTPIFPEDEGIAISHSILAKPGYAVGAVEVNGDEYVTALRIVFMKQDGGRLLTDDSYTSAWIGTPLDPTSYRLTGNGLLIVGIFGNRGLNVDGLGLVVLSGTGK